MLTIKRLDLADPRILIEGARDKAAQINVPMCIAVTDEPGAIDRVRAHGWRQDHQLG